MLYLNVNYYQKGKMEEYALPLSKVNFQAVVMLDVMYVIIQNDWNQKIAIMGVKGKATIRDFQRGKGNLVVNLEGKHWNAMLSYDKETKVFIITLNDILVMLDILKRNEKYGLPEAMMKMNEYCRRNEIFCECDND